MKRLLIFELRGTLLDRVPAETANKAQCTSKPDGVHGSFSIFLRPHVKEVLSRLGKTHDLALWSSAYRKNVTPLVPLLGEVSWKFVWTREITSPDEFRRSNPVSDDDNWAIVKDLTTVPRIFPEYSLADIIAVDDNAAKFRRHADNLIVIPTFAAPFSDDEALLRFEKTLERNNLRMPHFLQ